MNFLQIMHLLKDLFWAKRVEGKFFLRTKSMRGYWGLRRRVMASEGEYYSDSVTGPILRAPGWVLKKE